MYEESCIQYYRVSGVKPRATFLPGLCQTAMTIDPNFRKQVKEVLEHLYDTAYLETHPLLNQLALSDAANSVTRAQKLRSQIKDLIESLRPQTGLPVGAPEWRSYLALRYRFVQGMQTAQVEHELGISIRQLQREFHKGIDAITALLWEQRSQGSAEPLAAPSDGPEEIEELQQELEQWSFQRRACEVRVLIDDVIWMLRPLLEQHHTTLAVDLPAGLPKVMIDSTLTRQALSKLVRLVLPETPGEIHLRANLTAQAVELVLEDALGRNLSTEADWRIASLLCEQQGGKLSQSQQDGQTLLTLTLPHQNQRVVLVIDDNPALHQLFERYLATTRYTVMHAFGGAEGLELAESRLPDFITLDVMMAAVDGWQVLRSLHENPRTANIPVIVCSVLREPDLALALGAKVYLKKPVQRLQLQAALEEVSG
jgi:CheY-like chemotaxis protein